MRGEEVGGLRGRGERGGEGVSHLSKALGGLATLMTITSDTGGGGGAVL